MHSSFLHSMEVKKKNKKIEWLREKRIEGPFCIGFKQTGVNDCYWESCSIKIYQKLNKVHLCPFPSKDIHFKSETFISVP